MKRSNIEQLDKLTRLQIKQVDQIQQPLLTKPDLQQQPLKTNPESVVDKEDLSLMEEIGIPLEEAHQFYVKDILQCFKEKGAEKSQSTYYKYRLGLQTIGFFLSRRILSPGQMLTKRIGKNGCRIAT